MEEKEVHRGHVWLDFVQISLDCLKVLDGLLWAKERLKSLKEECALTLIMFRF